jgi:hypothetical protein
MEYFLMVEIWVCRRYERRAKKAEFGQLFQNWPKVVDGFGNDVNYTPPP